MQAESMMLDPNELVIDLPVDEANVKVKMESLQTNGIIQPVTVWFQDMRIIDGFHRTVAAQRLGWAEIPCYVIDCSESAFWDARIQSARQHHKIEGERLQVWIRECWRASDWPDAIAVMKDGQLRATNPNLIDMFVANVKEEHAIKPSNRFERWLVEERGFKYWSELANVTDKELLSVKGLGRSRLIDFRGKQHRAEDAISLNNTHPLHRVYSDDDFTPEEESLTIALFITRNNKGDLSNSLTSWFKEKAEQWGVTTHWLIEAIFCELVDRRQIETALYVMHGVVDNPTIGDVTAVHRALPIGRYYVSTDDQDEMRLYLKNRQEGETWDNYRKRKEKEDRTVRKIESPVQEITEADRERRRQDWEKRQRDSIKMQIELAKTNIRSCSFSFGFVPDAPAMLADFAQFVSDFTAARFPDVQVATPNPVALENSRLRAENAKLKERIASLERALGSKESAGPMIASAMAWSSTDFQQ